MIEITASDIFWIGAMDKISLGLMLTSLFCLLLIVIAVESSSVGLLLFALLLGIFQRVREITIKRDRQNGRSR